jgi:hypothetical protein
MLRVVEFKTEYPANREPVDMVLIAPIGAAFERQQTWHAVNHLRPRETQDDGVRASQKYQDLMAKWSVIGPAYEAWKAGNELPEDGTPLDAWSGVSVEQAKFLKGMGIKTVEAVRDMGDRTIEVCRWPNARKMPELAKKWLEGQGDAKAAATISDLQEQIAIMREMLEEKQEPKRGPGRPRKEVEAA